MKYAETDLSPQARDARLDYCAAYCPYRNDRNFPYSQRHSVTCVYHVDWTWTL